jgi:hypothetical protein
MYIQRGRVESAKADNCYKFNYSVRKSISELFASHTSCIDMTVSVLLFYAYHSRSNVKTIKWTVLKNVQLVYIAIMMAGIM